MTIRDFEERDREALKGMADRSGFPYCDPSGAMIEVCKVALDDDGNVIGAVAARRIVEIYAWLDSELRPVTKLALLREMHEPMIKDLSRKGYDEANGFLDPSICEKFGRRLQRSFGWIPGWRNWALSFKNFGVE